jgi:hypothetical protein
MAGRLFLLATVGGSVRSGRSEAAAGAGVEG